MPETYLKRQELESQFTISRSTIYRWMKAGTFPAAIHLGSNMVRWKASDIAAWIEQREVA